MVTLELLDQVGGRRVEGADILPLGRMWVQRMCNDVERIDAYVKAV